VGAGLLVSALGMTAAEAANVMVSSADQVLRPGMPNTLYVAALDDDKLPFAAVPVVRTADGATPVLYEGKAGVGVFRYTITPPTGVSTMPLTVQLDESRYEHSLPVVRLPMSSMAFPRRMSGEAGVRAFTFVVTGKDLPPVDAFQVSVAEGTVSGLARVEDGIKVTLELDDSPYPRVVAVGVRDRRRRERPRWGTIRLRAHPKLPLEVEPGSQAQFFVGSRSYGPFAADENGRMLARVDQYPGERAAEVTVVDGLGNETHTNVPLPVHYQPSVAIMPEGPQHRQGVPPVVFLHAVDGDGKTWRGPMPECSTPTGPVLVSGDSPGEWWFNLSTPTGDYLDQQRVRCSLSRDVGVSARIPVARSAGALKLRVWPEDLAADFPVAEFQVAIEDLQGERLPARGLQVTAERGEIRIQSPVEDVLRGEYDGSSLLDGGVDVLHVRYQAEGGDGYPEHLELGYACGAPAEEVDVFARVLDVNGSPLVEVPASLSVGGLSVETKTGQHGWAVARLPVPRDQEAFVVEATTTYRSTRILGVRGGRMNSGPGTPDLAIKRQLTILPGSVEGIEVSVDPPILFLGQRSTAFVRILFSDRVGIPVTDEGVIVEASEGQVGDLERQPDGSFIAVYQPESHQTPREVSITARMESSGRSASTRLELQPSPVDGAIGLSLGFLTSFGDVRPYGNLVLDWRTNLLERTVMFRFGFGQTWEVYDVPIAVGSNAELKILYYPVELGMLLRRDRQGTSFWVGGLGTVWPYWSQLRYGNDVVGDGFGVLPGVGIVGGVGRRMGLGELSLEARAHAVSGPQGDMNYSGNAGGLAVGLGYRVVY
jgi:hypothetical protein